MDSLFDRPAEIRYLFGEDIKHSPWICKLTNPSALDKIIL